MKHVILAALALSFAGCMAGPPPPAKTSTIPSHSSTIILPHGTVACTAYAGAVCPQT